MNGVELLIVNYILVRFEQTDEGVDCRKHRNHVKNKKQKKRGGETTLMVLCAAV